MSPAKWAIVAWGIGGVVLLLGQAVLRLSPHALSILDGSLTPVQWAIAAGWIAFMLYSEAWRGFHKQFSPRVVVRSLGLAKDPGPWLVLFAPVVAMGLFYGTRKRLIVSRSLLVGIVLLIISVRFLQAPWRGIIDAGVVLGLLFGTLSLLYFAARAVAGNPPDVPAEFPAS